MTKSLDIGIYKITNLINYKVYIGQSIRLQQRLQEHRNQLHKNNHYNNHLQRSYNKYGIENFKFEIIEYTNNINELNSLESYYIELYDSSNRNKGFNIETYIEGKKVFSEETKQKMSDSRAGFKPSKEHIENHRKSVSKKKQCANTTGYANISYSKLCKSYTVEFREKNTIHRLGYFKNLNFAILIRDLFTNYKIDLIDEMKLVLEQYKSKYGYYCVEKTSNKYSIGFKVNKNRIRLHGLKTLEEAATTYNTYILENNINKPLNIIPFDKGIWNNNQWYCNLS